MISGIPVSMGIAFGKALILDRSKVCILKNHLESDQLENEIERFRNAIQKSKYQLQEIKGRAGKGADKFGVLLDTYSLLLEDEILVNDTIENIRTEGINAEYALNMTLEKFMNLFDNINNCEHHKVHNNMNIDRTILIYQV